MAILAATQRTTYPLATYNFRVSVGDTTMAFTEVSGLVREHQTLTYRHGMSYWEGESISKFHQDKFAPITLRRGVVSGLTALYDWLEGSDARGVTISLCDEGGAAVVTWQVRKALLVKIEAPALQAASNEAAVETLTLMASGISIEHA